ncbi:MAG TPA: MarC family protein [Gemmatimonadales bacterium]|nr:MarC family protein [Gemmatimonadales bacterium]
MQADAYEFSLVQVFTLLFVMIGPLKLLGPFAAGTRTLDDASLRSLSLKAALIATGTLLAGGFLGKVMLQNWGVGVGALSIAGGIVFFLVSVRLVMEEYAPREPPRDHSPLTAFEAAFPLTVTPYGVAGFIALLSVAQDQRRVVAIVVITLLVLALDLLSMIYVRPLLKHIGLPLKLLGAVLGVLMLALSVQMVIDGLQRAGLVG